MGIIKRFPELGGTFFYSWKKMDPNLDGVPEAQDLYNFFASTRD